MQRKAYSFCFRVDLVGLLEVLTQVLHVFILCEAEQSAII